MTFTEQLLDSVNYPDSRITGLIWAPLGLRFHALHHLFPSLPYHNMAAAHRRLMAELPVDSPYRQTNCPSLAAAIGQLWRESRGADRPSGRSRRPHRRVRCSRRPSKKSRQALFGAAARCGSGKS